MELKQKMTRSRFTLLILLLSGAALACGPIDVARDILASASTVTPSSRSATGTAFIWYVAPDGDDGATCSYRDEPCRTIQGAVDKATDHDTIEVAAGTYNENPYSSLAIVVVEKILVINGAGPDATIIDGRGETSGVWIRDEARVRIEGVSVINGGGSTASSGITVRGDSTLTLLDSIVARNSRWGIDGFGEGELAITDVTISDNAEIGLGTSMDVSIHNSNITGNGHYGVSSHGRLEVTDSLIEANNFGGFLIEGTADFIRVTITNNGTGDLGTQDGIYIDGGDVRIVDSIISDNSRAGIVLEQVGSRLHLENSTIEGNAHPGLGLLAGTVTVFNSNIRENGAIIAETSIGAGVDIGEAVVEFINSRVSQNHNGGIQVGWDGSLVLENTTVDGNRNSFPGVMNLGNASIIKSTISNNEDRGVENRGTMLIANSTISANGVNGVSAVEGSLSITYSTIAYNGFNGLNAFNGGAVVASVSNTLISDNANEDCEISSNTSILPIPVSGTNLDSDGTCLFSDILMPELGVGPLGDNGGPTQTHALADGSPAIDAATESCPTIDQRGVGRPIGGGCDVGAFESAFLISGMVATSGEAPPTINRDLLCWKGPGLLYDVVSSIKAGIEVEILGIGVNGGWFIIDSPRFPGANCWVEEEKIDLDAEFDLFGLKRFAIPPLPTATPVLGCLYQGPNDNQPVCYPIDQCPVPFDQTDGACIP
jgi:hypothetical protein